MRYLQQHISAIISAYNGNVPLTHYLKNYFRSHPILGSRDRKLLSAMTYTWYRIARAVDNNDLLQQQLTTWLQAGKLLTTQLTDLLAEPDVPSMVVTKLFPSPQILSEGIDKEDWLLSMLSQPALFIRVRKDKDTLTGILDKNNVPWSAVTEQCLALPNGAKIDALLPEDCYVVQDASSQQTGNLFQPSASESWWDCCSGAGGKSLLLKDIEPKVQLTVSDKRQSIIHNLLERFKRYGFKPPVTRIADVSDRASLKKALGTQMFNNIICDAPCSGSGTWARTPEQLYFFKDESIDRFAAMQKNIAVNAAGQLKSGGRLIYITCSVFRNENEEVVQHIMQETGMQLLSSQLINGISQHADSMYAAVLQK